MTQALSAEEKTRLKKQWTELAIQQALASQWEDAVATNKNILNLFPTEAEAYNRLGKAYNELRQYAEARQAYSQTLKINPSNAIARKNLERLALIKDEEGMVAHTAAGAVPLAIDPALFNEEPGKTTITELVDVKAATLPHVSVGEQVDLYQDGHILYARNDDGEIIGQIEPRLANRLINLLEGGNRYSAAIRSLEQGQVRLIIRETYQHPSQFGTVSFPAQGGGDQIRAYIKDSMLRYDREEEDELLNEDEYYDGGDETDEMTEIDFEGSSDAEE